MELKRILVVRRSTTRRRKRQFQQHVRKKRLAAAAANYSQKKAYGSMLNVMIMLAAAPDQSIFTNRIEVEIVDRQLPRLRDLRQCTSNTTGFKRGGTTCSAMSWPGRPAPSTRYLLPLVLSTFLIGFANARMRECAPGRLGRKSEFPGHSAVCTSGY
jgi:hypothetical protein